MNTKPLAFTGDIVMIVSDGVTEARSTDNDSSDASGYGGRSTLSRAEIDAVLDLLLSAVNRFAAGAPQADDITALVLRYKGPEPADARPTDPGVGSSWQT
jgi:serine phosphatase RsbU (regulator of sigma subunit)